MTDWKLLVVYLAGLLVFYIAIGWLHTRSMNKIDDSKEYTMKEELDPRKIFGEMKNKPVSVAYSLGLVLLMVSLRYESPIIALGGSLLLIGTVWWSNRETETEEDPSG